MAQGATAGVCRPHQLSCLPNKRPALRAAILPAAAAQRALAEKDRALAEEKERNAAMAVEVEALKAQLARMAAGGGGGSPGASSDDDGGIRSYRPAAPRHVAAAAGAGLTPRSRLAQASAPAAAPGSAGGRLTPRSGAPGGATPRSGSGGSHGAAGSWAVCSADWPAPACDSRVPAGLPPRHHKLSRAFLGCRLTSPAACVCTCPFLLCCSEPAASAGGPPQPGQQ